MLKKLLIFLCAIFLAQSIAFADDLADVRAFFDNYVKDANSYSTNVPNYYMPNAKIIRVVHKKDGTRVSVPFPMSEYTKQMQKSSGLAKLVGYVNHYTNVKVTKQGADFKVSATRTPMKDKVGLPFHFIVTKTSNGYKVKEESMDTTVQDFLKYAK